MHKHGDSFCINPMCEPAEPNLFKSDRLLMHEMAYRHPIGELVNLHYHAPSWQEPCWGRFCRKRGTPKVEARDAWLVVATSHPSYWSRYPIRRCPRCKLHLGRQSGDSSPVEAEQHCRAAHGKPTHWCCPASCELQSVRQAKELDTAVVTTAVSRRPHTEVSVQWELAQDLAGRAVPLKVFRTKLVREEQAGRLHGCAHRRYGYSGRFHMPNRCQVGC